MKIGELINNYGRLTDRARFVTLACSFLIAAVAALDLSNLLKRIWEVPRNEMADPTSVNPT